MARPLPAHIPRHPLSPAGSWLLTKRTLAMAWQDRVLGMSAEAGFWMLVSLPPLLLALVGSLAYILDAISPPTLHTIEQQIIDAAGRVLTPKTVHTLVK